MKCSWMTLAVLFLFSTGAIARNTGSLTVVVRDGMSRLPVSMARVCFRNIRNCEESDTSGTVTFVEIPVGIHHISVSGFGYGQSPQKKVRIKKNTMVNVDIALDRTCCDKLEKVPLYGDSTNEHLVDISTTPQYHLNDSLVKVTGNIHRNILSILEKIPGVMNVPIDNSFHVRGGAPDENLFLIDGIEFENINHFSNLFTSGMTPSILNSDIMQQIDFYSGGFPVYFPQRLSSVTDIKIRSGSFTDYQFTIESNLTGVGFTAEGPIVHHVSFLSDLKLTDEKLMAHLLNKQGTVRCMDALLKLECSPTPAHTIKALGIGSFDDVKKENCMNVKLLPEKVNELYCRAGGMIGWIFTTEGVHNELLFSGSACKHRKYDDVTGLHNIIQPDTTMTSNYSEYYRSTNDTASRIFPDDTMAQIITHGLLSENRDLSWNGKIRNNLTLKINKNSILFTGFSADMQRYRFKRTYTYENSGELSCFNNNEWQSLFQFSNRSEYTNTLYSIVDMHQVGGFAEYSVNHAIITATIGIRGEYFDIIDDYGISPRLQFHITPPWHSGEFFLSCGHYYQLPFQFIDYMQSISEFQKGFLHYQYHISDVPPLDAIHLQKSNQGLMRYRRGFGMNHQLTVETYCKFYYNRYPNATTFKNAYKSDSDSIGYHLLEYSYDRARYGGEVLFEKTDYHRYNYSCSYSLYKTSNRRIRCLLNDNQNIFGQSFNASVGVTIARYHRLQLVFMLRDQTPDIFMYTGEENTTDKKYYYQMDLHYSLSIDMFWGSITGYIELWNVLNQKTVLHKYVNFEGDYREIKMAGSIPVAGFKVSF